MQNHFYQLTVDLVNKGMVRAIDISFHLWWPHKIGLDSYGERIKKWGEKKIEGNRYYHFVIEIFGLELVIFPGQSYPLISSPPIKQIYINYIFSQETYNSLPLFLYWELFSGDSPPQNGKVSFDKLNEF